MENKKSHYHHSAKERKQAFTYLREGKTVKEVAKLCDVHPSTIKNWKRSYALRGKDYLKATKAPYSRYPDELKRYAVNKYLRGTDAAEVAALLGILDPTSVTVWARDKRYREGLLVEEENRPVKNNVKRKLIKPLEQMSEQEELEFLRMENAILKKQISLRKMRQQQKRK